MCNVNEKAINNCGKKKATGNVERKRMRRTTVGGLTEIALGNTVIKRDTREDGSR